MIRRLAIALLIPSTLLAQDALRRRIDSLHTAMVAAFTADPASTAKFYTDDAAVVTGGDFRVVGREAVNNYWKSIAPGSTWKLEVLDAGGPADSPWVHGRSTLTTNGRVSLTDYIGILLRGPDGQLRFRVDAYTGGPATRSAGDEAAVRKLDSLWANMYARHDTAAALQLYSQSLIFVSADGRQKSRADELADVRPMAGLTMDYFRTNPTTVKAYDRAAVVHGTASWRFTMNGAPRQIERPYTGIYVRGGPLGWRLVAVQMGVRR